MPSARRARTLGLAARLTGWRIDIRSENEGQDEVVEEVWTEGDAVVDETVVVVADENGEVEAVVSDTVITDAEGDVAEVVVVETVTEDEA